MTNTPPLQSGRIDTRRTRVLGLIGVTLVLFCVCALIVMIGLNRVLPRLDNATNEFTSSSKGAEFVGELFLVMLEDGDWRRAYGMCTADLQENYSSAAGLGEYILKNNIRPISWEFKTLDSFIINQYNVAGKITFSDNHSGTVELTLMRNNSGWKIDAFTLTRR